MKRRDFIKTAAILPFAGIFTNSLLHSMQPSEGGHKAIYSPATETSFSRIMAKAKKEEWHKLSTPDCTCMAAREFLNIPYAGGTLEGDGAEVCRVNFTGMDCVTFVESSMALARAIKKQDYSFQTFTDELVLIRYRGGKLNGYLSRLHYTTDWIMDNEKKGIFRNVTRELTIQLPANALIEQKNAVHFMSRNSKYYYALRQDTTLIQGIAKIEDNLNKSDMTILDKSFIEKAGEKIMNGDLIALATNKKDLDYAHLGMAMHYNGKVHLLHASSKKKTVLMDVPVHEYAASQEAITGITVLRML